MAEVNGLSSLSNLEVFIDRFTAADKRPLNKLTERKATLNRQSLIFNDLKSQLNTLKSRVNGFNSITRENSLSKNVAVSSNDTIFTAEATSSAKVGIHSVFVSRIAKRDTALTDKIDSKNDSIANKFKNTTQTFKIKVGEKEVEFEISFNDKDESNESVLKRIATLVNDSGLDANASVIQVNKKSIRLAINSNETGSENSISFSEEKGNSLLESIGMLEKSGDRAEASNKKGGFVKGDSELLDASFNVNGVDIIQSSNVVTNVIEGITINLNKAHAVDDEADTISISPDSVAFKKEIEGFIKDYNDTIKYINAKLSTNPIDNTRGVFASNFGVRNLRNKIRNIVISNNENVESDSIKSLRDIGIEIQRDGTLKIEDEDKLDESLKNNSKVIQSLFSSEDGIADKIDKELKRFTRAGGVISDSQSSIKIQIRNIDSRSKRINERIDRKRSSLSKQFIDLQRLLSSLNTQQSYLQRVQTTFQNFNSGSRGSGLLFRN